ncbi:sulfite exporter TauE/SafE family protein [Paracoccus sp. M683]|uniref:sulfite exporter TauE/SafE family protein n=1 Tax=Paracoccus sp. M683 TaxID=2594268 RepID=UPI00117ECDE4|nr:sulfite exporter TauE/SafE family protein [Paracoccus sp. M683]TRW95699.1 sulfite exporter TauE/SafE family protein [Paracoccus sp. M683]
MIELLILFTAGLIGGVMNAVAGGGTFVTFPALVFAGIPPVAANATATVAALPGYLAAAISFRQEILTVERHQLIRLTLWTILGSAIGSVLLLVSSNAAFSVLVPFLLLAATVIFLKGGMIRDFCAKHARDVAPFGLGTLMPVAIYGGYFNGGLGIILLALFALWGMTNLNQMNGLKSWLSFGVSLISFAIFAIGGKVVWGPGAIMALGTIAGGLLGAPVSRRIPMSGLRALIAAIGFGMTAIFFLRLFNGD